MKEPFNQGTARKHIRAILDGPGMTVFTNAQTLEGWRYQAVTLRMTVLFSFRGHEHGGSAAPKELVIESARRNRR